MMNEKTPGEYNFWPAITDLMVSMFVVVLLILVFSYGSFIGKVKVTQEDKELLEAVDEALKSLDQRYFYYDPTLKRHILKVDVLFASNDSIILQESIEPLITAGRILYEKLDSLQKNTKSANLEFLVILEGNTAISYIEGGVTNKSKSPDTGYRLSFARALSLFNLWKNNGLNFRDNFERIELIVAGSGYFGKSRDPQNEARNRRFTIQITPKIQRKAAISDSL